MSGFGVPELLIVLVILLVFFGGASRIPKLFRSLGQASKEFKTGLKEGYKEEPLEGPCPFCNADVPAEAKFCPGCGKSAEEIVATKTQQAAKQAEAKTA